MIAKKIKLVFIFCINRYLPIKEYIIGNSYDEDNPSNDGGTPDDSNNADDNEA